MKKIGLTISLILLLSIGCQKDPYKLLLGKWVIQEAKLANMDQYLSQFKEKFNATDQEIATERERIKGIPESYYPPAITFEFGDSSKFSIGGTESKWLYSPDKQEIAVILGRYDTTIFKIKKLSRNELILIDTRHFSGIPLEIEIKLSREKDNEQ